MKIYRLFLLIVGLIAVDLQAIEIDRVIIWGHKLHTHTHSYIHYGFYKAFEHLGYPVYWFDDNDFPKDFDYSKALFIVANAVDLNVPLRDDSYYIFHHCWCKEHRCAEEKYAALIEKNRAISIKCFWEPYLEEDPDWIEVDTYIYKSLKYKELVFPWATDLLPYEIEMEKGKLPLQNLINRVIFIGTIGDGGLGANAEQLNQFMNAAKTSGLKVLLSTPWSSPVSNEEQKEMIQKSLLAPAIQGKWQCDVGYIPCRIFKSISYGKLGITNSKFVAKLFDNEIVFNEDKRQLFFDSLQELKIISLDKQLRLMDFVKSKHTYINRIELILNFLEEINCES